jgi:hypothetical protein
MVDKADKKISLPIDPAAAGVKAARAQFRLF